MTRCAALYSNAVRAPAPRTKLEVAPHVLLLVFPDGKRQNVALPGARFRVADATCDQRFVNHLVLDTPKLRVDLITPPDQGAIAPRAAGLPMAPLGAGVVETWAWETLVDWLRGRGRLGGRTVTELALLARLATEQFAVEIGEMAAQVAADMGWERRGPMRDSGGVHNSLAPLKEAARTSPRAADALMAALAATGTRRRKRRR